MECTARLPVRRESRNHNWGMLHRPRNKVRMRRLTQSIEKFCWRTLQAQTAESLLARGLRRANFNRIHVVRASNSSSTRETREEQQHDLPKTGVSSKQGESRIWCEQARPTLECWEGAASGKKLGNCQSPTHREAQEFPMSYLWTDPSVSHARGRYNHSCPAHAPNLEAVDDYLIQSDAQECFRLSTRTCDPR